MQTAFKPAYFASYESGELSKKKKNARGLLDDCTLCPRECHVNRIENETGICRTGRNAMVSSINPHFGEEPPLVGANGSGTIFFTHCNLMCNFCQNWDISIEGYGDDASDTQLAKMMMSLQNSGCHNINFVSPSHIVPQILSAVEIAVKMGLNLPLVYNSGGYDKVETLKLLDGVIDIYMPDFKFWETQVALKTCNAPDYPEIAKAAISEMHRQVGDLVIDEEGLAQRGLIVRHLVLPHGLSGTRQVMRFIATSLSRNTYVNVMSQYHPAGDAKKIPELAVSLSASEYRRAMEAACEEGIVRFAR